MADAATLPILLRQLRLPTMVICCDEVIDRAAQHGWSLRQALDLPADLVCQVEHRLARAHHRLAIQFLSGFRVDETHGYVDLVTGQAQVSLEHMFYAEPLAQFAGGSDRRRLVERVAPRRHFDVFDLVKRAEKEIRQRLGQHLNVGILGCGELEHGDGGGGRVPA